MAYRAYTIITCMIFDMLTFGGLAYMTSSNFEAWKWDVLRQNGEVLVNYCKFIMKLFSVEIVRV